MRSRYSCSLVHFERQRVAGLHVELAVQRQQGGGAAGGDAAVEGVAPMSRNACATSKPPTVKLPSTTVSICSDRVGAVPEQLAACVTLRGVGTATTVAWPLDSVVLELAGSNRHAQFSCRCRGRHRRLRSGVLLSCARGTRAARCICLQRGCTSGLRSSGSRPVRSTPPRGEGWPPCDFMGRGRRPKKRRSAASSGAECRKVHTAP